MWQRFLSLNSLTLLFGIGCGQATKFIILFIFTVTGRLGSLMAPQEYGLSSGYNRFLSSLAPIYPLPAIYYGKVDPAP